MNSKQRFWARVVLIFICLIALVLTSSLYWTQIIHGPSYRAKANKQYIKPVQSSVFDRGSIFFQSKDGTKVSVATIQSGFLVFMNPSLITDPGKTYQVLSQYLKLDKDDFLLKASKTKDLYEELARRVTSDKAQSIKDLSLPGIGVIKETWRNYPGTSLATQTLGIIGQDSNGVLIGKYGLERTYQDVLNRTSLGTSAGIFVEIFSGVKDSFFGGTIRAQGDIVSTIEPTVEKYLEDILKQTDKNWHPDEIGGIIIDPQTGEIRAIASLPSFDPNNLKNLKDASILANPLVEHVYELGSIMKPLTVSIGIDTGAIYPNWTYDDTGCMTLDTKKICNYDGKARGVVGIQQILSQSLNMGVATVALEIGKSDFVKYFGDFGFGDKTGIDQPNEATGLIKNIRNGHDIEMATAAYGQGVAVSPVSMTRALSILGNGGYLITPHLVKSIEYLDGSNKNISPSKGKQVLKKETVNEVTRMLVKVVDTALKDGAIKMQHYSVAAKTGTAQIPDHKNGGYYTDKYLHSFFGYFPAYNPEFLIFLYQIHPKGAQYASETLTEPFSEIVKFLINYYNVPPDR